MCLHSLPWHCWLVVVSFGVLNGMSPFLTGLTDATTKRLPKVDTCEQQRGRLHLNGHLDFGEGIECVVQCEPLKAMVRHWPQDLHRQRPQLRLLRLRYTVPWLQALDLAGSRSRQTFGAF